MKKALAVCFITLLLLGLAAGFLTAQAAETPKSNGQFVPTPTPQPTATPRPASKPTPPPAVMPDSVKISGKSTRTLNYYDSLRLKAVVTPSDAETKLTWTSSNPDVVFVDYKGEVTGMGLGSATVTVRTSNGKKASVKIKVPYMKGKCGEHVTFRLDRKGVMTIAGKGEMYEYENYNYNSGDGIMFARCIPRAREVVIKKGVTRIGTRAFEEWPLLKKVTVAGSVQTIGRCAFESCKKLTSVKLSDGLKTIGERAFSGTSLKSVKLPKSVETIEYGAFSGCKALATVTFNKGLRTIGSHAFSGCKALAGVTFRKGLRNIASYAFSGCKLQKEVILPDGVTYIGERAFGGCKKLRFLTIPASVIIIPSYGSDNQSSPFNDDDRVTIKGYRGSYAEWYADVMGIPFKAIG